MNEQDDFDMDALMRMEDDGFSHYPSDYFDNPDDRIIVVIGAEPQIPGWRNWSSAILQHLVSLLF